MKRRLPLSTLCLLVAVVALLISLALNTAKHNAQLMALTQQHNAQLAEMTARHNTQLLEMAARLNTQHEPQSKSDFGPESRSKP